MKRRAILAILSVMVTAGVVVGGSATIAHAAETEDIYCEVIDSDVGAHYSLHATVEYADIGFHGVREYRSYRYRIGGGSSAHDKNNVNFRLSQLGTVFFTHDSADNIEFGRWYTYTFNPRIRTTRAGVNDLIEFTGIFDQRWRADPKCTAWLFL
jgi:hypothetical protein